MEPIMAGFPGILTEMINKARAEEFVREFLERSNVQKQNRIPIWDEMLENRMVTPRSYRQQSGSMTDFGTQEIGRASWRERV